MHHIAYSAFESCMYWLISMNLSVGREMDKQITSPLRLIKPFFFLPPSASSSSYHHHCRCLFHLIQQC
jgi:hypothetical protein